MFGWKLLRFLVILIEIIVVMGKPYRRMILGTDDGGVTTREINLNDTKQKQQILTQFNISPEEIERRRLKHMSSSTPTPQPNGNDPFRDIKENRRENIKNQILDVFRNPASQEDTIHEMAAYPICNQGNESQWQQDSNITYIFSSTLFEKKSDELYLDTAVLRLFKLNPNDPETKTTPKPNNCDDIDSQIRVTVSTVQRRSKRGETEDRKKRICNTMMLNVSHTGWVEIDVRRAINIWEKSERQIRSANLNNNNNNNNGNGANGGGGANGGSNSNKPVLIGWLTIEVHDEEERPLKPGLYFEPPKCSQAYPAVPWNFYRIYSWSSNEMEKVPRSPRLDIKLIDQRGQATYKHHYNRFDNNNNNNNNNNNMLRSSFSPNCNHNAPNHNNYTQQQQQFSQAIYDDLIELFTTNSTAASTTTTIVATTNQHLYETSPELHRIRHSHESNSHQQQQQQQQQHHHHHNNHHHHHSTDRTIHTDN